MECGPAAQVKYLCPQQGQSPSPLFGGWPSQALGWGCPRRLAGRGWDQQPGAWILEKTGRRSG